MNSEDSFTTIKLDELAEQFVDEFRAGQNPDIESCCQQHPELAAQIRELFPALARMEAVVRGEIAAESPGTTLCEPGHPDCPETPGGLIGNYRLIRKIGEGGFGQVFECEQVAPVHRTVALKLIKPGMDSREVVSRFEAERQALAALDHPNIARVFDGGTTVLGRPYFVMELVHGTSITRYCDEHRLTVQQRIELLIDVCRGIQHAHQQAIIHRDIKPSNILVTEVDGRPACKIIDFGISKALDSNPGTLSHQTRTSQMIGTPLYMSPEQASSTSGVTDTRSDIYSIGCVLYELLTGVTPFSRDRLTGLSLQQIQKIIADEEVLSLAKALSASKDQAQETASLRATTISQLALDLRNEPDWISLRCLEKDRDRRYQSAFELSQDLQRYLSGEPVVAAPASPFYRFRKFVRRRKSIVFAALLFLASVVTGIAGTVTGLLKAQQSAVEATNQAKIAGEERDKARSSEQKLEDSNKKLNARLAQLENYNSLLTGIFSDFDVYRRRTNGPGLEMLLVNRLAETGKQLMEGTIDDPESLALIEYRLGDLLHSLGRYEDAIRLTEHALTLSSQSLGKTDILTLQIQRELAWCYYCINDYEKAVPLALQAHAGFSAVAGPNAPNTLGAHGNAGAILNAAGRHEDALKLLLDLVDREREVYHEWEPDTFKTMSCLGETYLQQGDGVAATKWLQLAYERQIQYIGIENPQTCKTAYWLAKALRDSADPRGAERAVRILEESRKHLVEAFGSDHPEVVSTQKALQSLLMQLGRTTEAASISVASANDAASESRSSDDQTSAQRRVELLTKTEAELAGSGRSLSNEDARTLICALEQLGRFAESNQWRERMRLRAIDLSRRQWEESLTQSGPNSPETLSFAIELTRWLKTPEDDALLSDIAQRMGQVIGSNTEIVMDWKSVPDHQKIFDSFTSRGFVPFDFDVQFVNDQRQIRTTYRYSRQGQRRVMMWTGQTVERFAALKSECSADQMDLLVERTCQTSDQVEYAGLWHKKALPNLGRSAHIRASHSHEWGSEMVVSDGIIPLSSRENISGRHSWFSHLGTSEWIEYRFDTPVTCSHCGVFWVADANEPGCRIPESWVVKYLDGDEWKDVSTSDNFATQPDRINEVRFQPIQTKSLRLEVQLQKNFSAGVFEWFVAP
jgi:serine/threonine protein kinase